MNLNELFGEFLFNTVSNSGDHIAVKIHFAAPVGILMIADLKNKYCNL